MAYIVRDEDTSMALPAGENFRSFLVSGGEPNLMAPPSNSFSFVKRNLLSEIHRVVANDTVMLPLPSEKESVSVYLRIKPKTPEETEFYSCSDEFDLANIEDENFEVVTIESAHQIALNAPKESITYKNSVNNSGSLFHRFTFNKIFSPASEQEQIFNEMVLPKLKEFFEGRNQLIFTYGATSSGKTFTIQGISEKPGILPRALDSIFNTVVGRQLEEPLVRPEGYNRVTQVKPEDFGKIADEKYSVFRLGKELRVALHSNGQTSQASSTAYSEDTQNFSQATNQSLATMFPHLQNRVRETALVTLSSTSKLHYSIWVSFAEVYNENCYDLLEKLPEVKRKGDKPRRIPLKIAEDRGGNVYIRGLKEVLVSNADEAYQLLLIGRENLHFASTRLNHHSSRSHCIFTIKVIRVFDKEKPHLARMSMLSFCDLAGSERIKKTLNTGDRQKEAGNINTSLLVLSRCIKALRHNQGIKDAKKHHVVPFRDSKLTRLFQSYFTGLGKCSMVVNISQNPYLFDESLQVCKFAAVASKVTIEISKEPEAFVAPAAAASKPAAKKNRRQSNFSMIVNNRTKESFLTGRGSIAWDQPQIRSTLCPMPDAASTTIMEEDEASEIDDTNAANETAVDERYSGLLAVIDDLKNQLIEEKQKNIRLEAEVRTELCEEFNKMIVEVETNWEQRLQEERDRAADLSEWRINKLQEAYKERNNQRKRQREDSEDEAENVREKLEEAETKLSDKAHELEQLEKQVTAMKSTHNMMTAEQQKQKEQLTKQTFELSTLRSTISSLEMRLAASADQLKTTNEALEANTSEPKLKEQEQQISELNDRVVTLEKEKEGLKKLLDEAAVDLKNEEEENGELSKAVAALKCEMATRSIQIRDLEAQIDEDRELLSSSSAQIEEKDQLIIELEEQVIKMKEKEARENSPKWLERKAVEQQVGALNDEIESLKTDKKKLRAVLDEKEVSMKGKDEEIKNLEREVKTLIQAEKRQRESCEETQAEVTMLRKQIKDLNLKVAEVDSLTKKLKEKDNLLDNLQLVVDATKKQGNAVEALRVELDRKNKEKSELDAKIEELEASVESTQYELDRTKQQKEELMKHYEQTIKKLSDDLSLEKNEQKRIREVMARNTPKKSNSNLEQEIQALKETKAELTKKLQNHEKELDMLRKELQDKTNCIQNLSKQIAPTPKKDQGDEDDVEELRQENVRLQKELEERNSRLSHMSKAYQKTIEEYKETNVELLKNVGIEPATSSLRTPISRPRIGSRTSDDTQEAKDQETNAQETVKPPVRKASKMASFFTGQADESFAAKPEEDIETNEFLAVRKEPLEEEEKHSKRKPRGKATLETQNSTEDSSRENENPDDQSSSMTSPPRKTPRRGTRVSGKRPVTNRTRAKSCVSFAEDEEKAKESEDSFGPSSAGRTRKVSYSNTKPLSERNASVLSPLVEFSDAEATSKTPANGRKKLFSSDSAPVEFTPPDFSLNQSKDAHSIVKRSLRTRGNKKN